MKRNSYLLLNRHCEVPEMENSIALAGSPVVRFVALAESLN